jgi:two-component system, cell cycle response regulator DivK
MPPPSAPAPLDAELHGKVLYVEDVDVNFVMVEAGLAAFPGIELIRATTGHDGVRKVRSEHPDFVLLDMHLRVTILTGDELTMDVIKAMSLGAFEYWIKPVDVRVLKDGVRRALSGNRADPARTLAPHTPRTPE